MRVEGWSCSCADESAVTMGRSQGCGKLSSTSTQLPCTPRNLTKQIGGQGKGWGSKVIPINQIKNGIDKDFASFVMVKAIKELEHHN